MKTVNKLVAIVGLLFAIQQSSQAQNWGFSLPFGGGGFAINGKNWAVGLPNGAAAGGGQGGWGFQLPSGVGFYNGGGGGPAGVMPCGGGGYYGNPQVAEAYWTGVGGSYDRNGWNYGPGYYQRRPESTAPVRRLPVPYNYAKRGGAAWQAIDGRVWVRQPF